MTKQDSGANCMSAATVPGNIHVVQPTCAVGAGSQEKPLGMTSYPASATVLQYHTGTANLQIQNPATVTGIQSQPTGLQYPVGTTGVQIPPGVIQYSPDAMKVQILPGDPQNPLNAMPGATQTSGQSQWNMSFVTLAEFNPKKFINEEVRTLGAIQILIGLFHIFSAINPLLYMNNPVLGVSGYLIWGGLSFIISGSLSILAEKDPSSCVVNGSIGMNVVSSIFSLLGIAIIIADLSIPKEAGRKAISGSLLPFALLEFILTCMVSHFGCQAVCWTHFENMTVISNMFNGNTVNTTGPVNTTTSPAGATTSPATATTSPATATTSPVNSTFPSNAPPEHAYQGVNNLAQR